MLPTSTTESGGPSKVLPTRANPKKVVCHSSAEFFPCHEETTVLCSNNFYLSEHLGQRKTYFLVSRLSNSLEAPGDCLWLWADNVAEKSGVRFLVGPSGKLSLLQVRLLILSTPSVDRQKPRACSLPLFPAGLVTRLSRTARNGSHLAATFHAHIHHGRASFSYDTLASP